MGPPRSIIIPDAPVGEDVALEAPDFFNYRNALLRQLKTTFGPGFIVRQTPNGISVALSPIASPLPILKIVSNTATQGKYNCTAYVGTPSGFAPSGMTALPGTVFLYNAIDQGLGWSLQPNEIVEPYRRCASESGTQAYWVRTVSVTKCAPA